jgi:chromosome segregation protein
VADAIHAEEEYRAAVEAALGEVAGLVVVEMPEEAEDGIRLLREEGKGKVSFVSLGTLPRIETRAPVVKIPGVRGWAHDFARFEPRFRALFTFLLDGILIVEDRDAAARAIAALGGVRCVTLDGEVATGVGIVRGGSRRSDEGGRIGKTRRIEELEAEIAGLEARAGELAAALASRTAAIEAIDLKAMTDDVKAAEKEMNAVEMRIAQLAFEKKRATDEIARSREEDAALREEAAVLQADIGAAMPALDALRAEKTDVERSASAAAAELELLQEEWNERTAGVTALGLDRVKIGADLQSSRSDLERAGAAIASMVTTAEKRDLEIAAARAEMGAARASIDSHRASLESLRAELGTLEERRSAVESESNRVRDETHRIELKLKDERRRHDESVKTAHELELRIADLRARMSHLAARAAEEFDVTLVVKSYPDDEFVDFAAVREEIQGLKDKLKNLGNVNFAAFEEYTGEKERLEFLTSQRNDLLEAEQTLLSTIEEINQTAQRKFLETFEKIRTNFVDIFKSLFDPGDECDLKLEEEVDPLEAAIDIIAKPRGKRPTSIHLLSGGEKTLTAIALLFAIYLVKPSPFCILDEVDAPLDDANIDRFTRILRKFSDNTQFIVVTHNKRTMEAANALYGVTMEEEGVSKIVQVRFQQGAAVASAQLATG